MKGQESTRINKYNLRVCKGCSFSEVHVYGDGIEDFSVGCKLNILTYAFSEGWKDCPYKFEQELFGALTYEESESL